MGRRSVRTRQGDYASEAFERANPASYGAGTRHWWPHAMTQRDVILAYIAERYPAADRVRHDLEIAWKSRAE